MCLTLYGRGCQHGKSSRVAPEGPRALSVTAQRAPPLCGSGRPSGRVGWQCQRMLARGPNGQYVNQKPRVYI